MQHADKRICAFHPQKSVHLSCKFAQEEDVQKPLSSRQAALQNQLHMAFAEECQRWPDLHAEESLYISSEGSRLLNHKGDVLYTPCNCRKILKYSFTCAEKHIYHPDLYISGK